MSTEYVFTICPIIGRDGEIYFGDLIVVLLCLHSKVIRKKNTVNVKRIFKKVK